MTAEVQTIAAKLNALEACDEALSWADGYPDERLAWKECQRGDWMLWLIGKTTASKPWTNERKPLLACCLDCACTAQEHWPEKQREAIGAAVATLRRWITGEATLEQAKESRRQLQAAADADAATYATYTAYAAHAAACATYAARAAADAAAHAAYAAHAAHAAYAADAAAPRSKVLASCADIVRRHFPNPPVVKE